MGNESSQSLEDNWHPRAPTPAPARCNECGEITQTQTCSRSGSIFRGIIDRAGVQSEFECGAEICSACWDTHQHEHDAADAAAAAAA